MPIRKNHPTQNPRSSGHGRRCRPYTFQSSARKLMCMDGNRL